MCISLGPAEFKGTVIANFPQSTDNEQERVLSYMNSVLSAGTLPADGKADGAPNAMVFPVYGEITGVLDCDDPAASRQWLSSQGGRVTNHGKIGQQRVAAQAHKGLRLRATTL